MSTTPSNAVSALAVNRLQEVIDYLTDQIDGGDECLSHDQNISDLIRSVEGAQYLIKALQAYADGVGDIARSISKSTGNTT